jgi:hypothetical protein
MRPMTEQNRYWFPAKRYGWGWGPPRAWQGWVVMLCSLAAIALATRMLLPDHPVALPFVVLGIVALLLAICYRKGEPPRWRWGDPR